MPFRLLLAGLLLSAVWLPARARDPYLLLTAGAWTFAALGSVRFLSIAGPLLVVALAPAVGVRLGSVGIGAGQQQGGRGRERASWVGGRRPGVRGSTRELAT